MMVFLFFIFVALVVFHFVYDAILAPSIRFELRLQLFEIRDQIRMLKIVHGSRFDDNLYNHLQNSVNKQIRLLHNINIVGVLQAYKIVTNNKELTERLHEVESLVAACDIEEVKLIHYRQLPGKFGLALAANSGGWGVYVVSLLVPLLGIALLCAFAASQIRQFANKILEMPDDKLSDTFAYQ